MENPTPTRSILKSFTWIGIIVLTCLLWYGIIKALSGHSGGLGATDAPGRAWFGQRETPNPGPSRSLSFFFEHNVCFSGYDTYKLNVRLKRTATRPHRLAKYSSEYLDGEKLYNIYYVKYDHRNQTKFGLNSVKLGQQPSSDPKGEGYAPLHLVSPKLRKVLRDKQPKSLLCGPFTTRNANKHVLSYLTV